MINIYKKCEKSRNNPSGYQEVEVSDLSKPFLLCISAQDFMDKSILGIIREGAHAARFYTSQEIAGGFKIDKAPVDILGLKFRTDDNYKYNYEEITDKLLWPYLTQNGLDLESIKETAKKMNFMTYCDGTFTYGKIENYIENKLKDLDFKQEDINEIFSNLSLVSIGSMINTSNYKTTSINFIDVNDPEIMSEYTDEYKKLLARFNKRSAFGNNSKQNILYIYDGTGTHSIKEYLAEGRIVKPALSSIVSYLLEKSIASCKDKSVNKSIDDMIEKLKKYANEGIDSSSLLDVLDSEISYDNTPKYTHDEIELRKELDSTYKELMKSMLIINRTKKEYEDSDTKMKSLINSIQEFSSDTTMRQILASAGVWKNLANSNVLYEKSDRAIREEYEQSKSMNVSKAL